MPNPFMQATVEYQTEAHLGEGPVWDENEQKLWWVDILSGKIHQYDPAKKENLTFDAGEHVGAIALRKKGGLLLARKSGFAFVDDETGEITPLLDPEEEIPNNRFNDGKCDPSGRFWAGTMAYDLKEGAGNLWCLDSDLEITKKLDGVTISNGLVWNSRADRFFFIDTMTGDLCSFQYENESGRISGKTVIIHIEDETGYPDGMTIDTEDKLWVALYGGGKVIRINPENAEIEFEIHLPVPKPTSCTFGGQNLNELYITTCREHMSDEEIEQAPLSGSLFQAELSFQGLPADRFGG